MYDVTYYSLLVHQEISWYSTFVIIAGAIDLPDSSALYYL